MHDAVLVQELSKPPTAIVAVSCCPPIPVVSTLMTGVPCPSVIVPAVLVHMKVKCGSGPTPLISAVNITMLPACTTSVGQRTVIVGQRCSTFLSCERVGC